MQASLAVQSTLRRSFKSIATGALLVFLGAVVAYAILRETGTREQPVVAAIAEPERPALTGEEETYAQTLWGIHSQVRTDAVRMIFAGLSYKMKEIDRAEVKTRVAPLTKAFGDARARAQKLTPPASLQELHGDYLQALELYRASTLEMVKVAADGNDEHLIKAQVMSEEASGNLLKVGDHLWPGEHKPH